MIWSLWESVCTALRVELIVAVSLTAAITLYYLTDDLGNAILHVSSPPLLL